MEYGKWIAYALLGIMALWLLIRLIRLKQIKAICVTSAVSGVIALAVVCMIGHWQSETLHINPYTLGVSVVLGVPGVILMTCIKILWAL